MVGKVHLPFYVFHFPHWQPLTEFRFTNCKMLERITWRRILALFLQDLTTIYLSVHYSIITHQSQERSKNHPPPQESGKLNAFWFLESHANYKSGRNKYSYPTLNQLYTSPHLPHDSLLMTEWSVTDLLCKFTLGWLRPMLTWMRKTSFTLFMVYPWPQSQVSRGLGTFFIFQQARTCRQNVNLQNFKMIDQWTIHYHLQV